MGQLSVSAGYAGRDSRTAVAAAVDVRRIARRGSCLGVSFLGTAVLRWGRLRGAWAQAWISTRRSFAKREVVRQAVSRRRAPFHQGT